MNFSHGHARKGKKSVEYWTWQSIIGRCHRPKHTSYPIYGGRGIAVCVAWRKSFAVFLRDVGKRPSARHSIERRNNRKGYTPGNVAWVLRIDQNRNRRNNVLVTIDGSRKPLSAWAEELNIPYGTVRNRMHRGWSARRALTEPNRSRRKPIDAKTARAARKLYASGWSVRKIADRFGLHGGAQNIVAVVRQEVS